MSTAVRWSRSPADRAAAFRLRGVSRSFGPPGRLPQVVILPTSLDLPLDRPVAVIGGKGQGKSTLLGLLAGTIRPETGAVLHPGPVSPVINGGRFLHPSLTGIENIRFISRTYGLSADRLMLAVDAFSGLGRCLADPVRTLDGGDRRALEVAVAMMLPFGCYLIDDAHQLAPALLDNALAAAAARGAGMIFATVMPRLARRHGERIVVIADATLRLFDDPEVGIAFYEGIAP